MKAQTGIFADLIPHLPRGVRLRHDRVRRRWVLLAPERIFEIDEIGVEILQRCDGASSVQQIAEDLAATFEASPDDVRADVETFLRDFASKRVIDL
jgi:pyrroloquinoline quinone biosynthesis protein D